MLGRRQDQVGDVENVVGQEQRALPARDPVARQKDRQTGDHHGDHHRNVECDQRRRYREAGGRDEGGQPQDREDVEEVAAHDVAHGDVALALEGSDHRCRYLRQRSPCRDDGQADHHFAQTQQACSLHRPVDQPVGAEHEQGQPGHHECDLVDPVSATPRRLRTELLVIVGRGGGPFPPCLHDEVDRVCHDSGEQQRPLGAAHIAVERKDQKQDRGADHQRHFLAHELLRDDQRRDQRRQPQDEQHVEDVAADHVAHGDVGLARPGRLHAHRHLRCAGAERHHRQADH